MAANKLLDHDPPSSWRCYSAAGADGANRGNIGLTYGAAPFGAGAGHIIDDFVADEGANNAADLYHRSVDLCPMRRHVAYGLSTDAATSAVGFVEYWAGGSDYSAPLPEFVALPAADLYPARFGSHDIGKLRWSIGIPNASYAGATVEVVDVASGQSLAVSDLGQNAANGCLPLLIYSVAGVEAGHTYQITAKNVAVGGTAKNIVYKTTLVSCP